MTESASLQALAVFKAYFKKKKYDFKAGDRRIDTTLQFGFFGSHDLSIVAHPRAVSVGVQIVQRVPPGFEETIEQFGRETDGRVTLDNCSGALMWGGAFHPDCFASSDDIAAVLRMVSFETCVVEGYLDQYAKDGKLPGAIFFNGLAYDYTIGTA